MVKKARIKLFKITKANNLGIHECPSCGIIEEPVVKMGGLICPGCRTILVHPGTDEFNKRLEKALKVTE